jgi:hypothetical protein
VDSRVNHIIYVISDSTGETAERVIRAALSQFYDNEVRVQRLRQVRNQDDIHQALSVVFHEPGMVAYTLVDPQLAETVERIAEEHILHRRSVERTYHSFRFSGQPRRKAGLHRIDTDYHKRLKR